MEVFANFLKGLFTDNYTLALLIMVMAIIGAIHGGLHYKKSRIFTPIVILIAGTFSCAVVLFYKIENTSFFNALHNAMKLFVIDYSFENSGDKLLKGIALIAPILTFTAVLALLRDVCSHIRLCLCFICDRYIFSELNEKSIALAESIRSNHHLATIVFLNVNTDREDCIGDLYERARVIQAICFKKDIFTVNFKYTFGKLFFFAISQMAEENVRIATSIRSIYGNCKKTRLYIFSSSAEAEMFTGSTKDENIQVRCINEPRAVVYNKLFDLENSRINNKTPDLFTSAITISGEKIISAVIVGMEEHGTEMLKALAWFCQMDGYHLKINAFDKNNMAEAHLTANCPELLDERHNHTFISGEAEYDIILHSNTDVETDEFQAKISSISDATFVFISLGTDQENIAAAARLRMLFERHNRHPMIQAVVHNSDKAELLSKSENFAGQKYDIEYIGDLKKAYSEDVLLNSTIEKQALNIHKKWGGTARSFYSFAYNYNSSMAAALHLNALIACRMRGLNIQENAEILSILEHKRWNAYMRTEGYKYGKTRNDLAKEHPDLVPYNELSEWEKDKDRRISLTVLDVNKA